MYYGPVSAQEYEDIRAAGSDERRELTHAVMRELDAPDNWTLNGEYGSEFGPLSPSRSVSRLPTNVLTWALCSPGDAPVWVLVLVNAGGEPFAVVQVQRRFAPEAVSHSLALWRRHWMRRGTALIDLVHILMAEVRHERYVHGHWFPSGASNRPHGGRWRRRKTPPSGNTLAEYPYAGAFFRC